MRTSCSHSSRPLLEGYHIQQKLMRLTQREDTHTRIISQREEIQDKGGKHKGGR